ncbi:MAG: leucine-rich repeat protein [Ruminococcus sp.]|nr:leucine-rich repeat protein [Ruminococcus sp.]
MKTRSKIAACAVSCAVLLGGAAALPQVRNALFSGTNVSAAVYGDYIYDVKDGKAHITGYTGTESYLSVPSSLDGRTVVCIDDGAFCGNENLKYVSIPSTVERIGLSAFESCTSVSTLNIGSGVKTIDATAFAGCTGITSVSIPASVTKIGVSAFEGCTKLSSVIFPATGDVKIDDAAFINCPALKTVTVQKGVTKIGEMALGYSDSDGSTGKPVSGFTVRCYKDTEAESYAVRNGFNISIMDPVPAASSKAEETDSSKSGSDSSDAAEDVTSSAADSQADSSSSSQAGEQEQPGRLSTHDWDVDAEDTVLGCGDVNCDGSIDYLDIDYMISFISKDVEISPAGLKAADCDGDGDITYLDLSKLISAINTEITLPKSSFAKN